MQLWSQLAAPQLPIACPGLVWFLENPVGSLEMRPYMVQYLEGTTMVVQTIHYCAHGRTCKEPTRLWANMFWWVPQGRTGTGQCLGVHQCLQMEGTKHINSTAGGGRRVGGRGPGSGGEVVSAVMQELAEAYLWRLGGIHLQLK